MNKYSDIEIQIANDLLKRGYKWLVRDMRGNVVAFSCEPYKIGGYWSWPRNAESEIVSGKSTPLFQSIKWEDPGPTYIEVVLKWLDMENEEQIPVSTSLEHEGETTTDEEKHDQLAGRLYELSALNARIGNLTYYMNNNPMVGIVGEELTEQLDAMCRYRDALERRIVKGIY